MGREGREGRGGKGWGHHSIFLPPGATDLVTPLYYTDDDAIDR